MPRHARIKSEEFTYHIMIRSIKELKLGLSPIVSTTGVEVDRRIKERTLHITEDKFTENIKKNLLEKYLFVHGREPANPDIEINFDPKWANKDNRVKLIDIKGITVKGFVAPFKMKCSDDIKKVAIDCGIGENNSIGMGYILEKAK